MGDPGLVPGLGQSPPEFLPGDSMDRGAWWATVQRVTESAQLTVSDSFTTIGEVMVNKLPPKCVLSFRCTWGVVPFQ